MKNTIASHWYDKKNRMGHLEVNGYNVSLYPVVIGYRDDGLAPRMGYGAQVAQEQNMSNLFLITAPTLRGLLGKIRRYPHVLVSHSRVI